MLIDWEQVMVRPRVGDFVYTDSEIEVMIEDISIFKENGAHGIVFGVLTADGRVDSGRTRRSVICGSPATNANDTYRIIGSLRQAYNLKVCTVSRGKSLILIFQVCFHRAFDMTRDPGEGMVCSRGEWFKSELLVAFKDVASIGGITRILTSGQKSTVLDSLDIVKSLLASQSSGDNRAPSILPGSGINATTVERVVAELETPEIHLSGGRWVQGQMQFRREGMGMGIGDNNDWSIWMTSEAAIKEVRNKVDTMNAAPTAQPNLSRKDMGKRELAALGIGNGAPDVEGLRSRRKLDHAPSSSDVEMESAETSGQGGKCKEEVRVQGLKLWQIVKDATKDGRSLTTQFLKQPHRRTYPDYYVLIKHPIALEDVKKKLDSRSYPALEAVKQDLDLCFTNAKAYNRKDSEIYQDAKDLLKLTNKTYHKMLPSEEEGEGKHKPPSLNRLIKSRLQKLVDKTDDDGRSISYEFMELPSRKDWPIYYKEIKKPQCLNFIMKRIKHKEYASSSQFAEDVELVFANALHFNQEGTVIWEDARTLRDYFRTLMADMPPPFDLLQYSRPTNKIKIKMPAAAQASTASGSTTQPIAATTSTTLRLPASSPTQAESSQSSSAKLEKQESLPAPIPTPTLPVAPNNAVKVPKDPPASAQPPAPMPKLLQKSAPKQAPKPNPAQSSLVSTTVTPAPPLMTTPVSIAQPFLQLRPSPAPAPPPSEKSNPPPMTSPVGHVHTTPTAPSTPVPPPVPQHRLKCVKFRTEPRGRWINLDHRDGVASWAMRLDKSEQSLYFHEISFFEEVEEEEESGGEEENEEEDVDMEIDSSPKQGKKKKRGRGRPKATRSITKTATKAGPVQKKKKASKGETQVKLNGTVVDQKAEDIGRWTVDLVIGPNTLEVGEKGGVVWRIYAERLG
ncbi:hypothetical protein E1B28_001474 [Marasmius oreades]|uniref:Bromo domain-containing protein n=1 Tax=Marasmius oreades TaxID=181124 RepID=A0A9P7V3N0_9AGAR|nr:uncharacterized protein E1B28_001474 [Marasmius oreades]KAG7099648.1 hypothetical protein E1B28_001474 [Marasmius oreades]